MPNLKRIMLVEAKPRVVQPKVYGTLSTTDKHSSISLSAANLVATRGAGAPTTAIVRATVGLVGRSMYWETQRNSGTARAGLCMASMPLDGTAALGTGLLNVAGPDASGACTVNGVTTATVGTVATTDVICHWYDAGAGAYRVRKNGGAWQLVVSAPKHSRAGWFPCVQLNASSAMRIALGPAFAQAVPAGVSSGVYTQAEPVETTVYFSSDKFNTLASETPASTHYFSRIKAGSDVVIARSVRSWLHGSSTSNSRGTLTILNGDRRLDAWNDYVWRDARYSIFAGYEGDARAAFTTWATGVVDDIGWDNEGNIILSLADPLARLERAIQAALYGDDAANPQIANRGKPIALGRPLYCEGVLLSTATTGPLANALDVHDDAAQQIDAIYDKGDLLLAPPTDWTYLPGRTGARLVNAPDYPVVFNPRGAVEQGAVYMAPPDGNFSGAWVGPTPAGWMSSLSTGAPAGYTANASPGARFISNGSGNATLHKYVAFPGTANTLRIDIDVRNYVSGTIYFSVEDGIGGRSDTTFTPVNGRNTFFLSRPASYILVIVAALSTSGVADYVITNISITESLGLIERLPAWIKYLAVTRGPLTAADLDTATIAALDGAAPYRLAKYIGPSDKIKDVLVETMDSFCGWVTTNRLGQVTVGRLERAKGSPVLVLDKGNITSIVPSIDLAKGYTTKLAGRRNNRVHTDADLVTSITPALRAELTTEWLSVKTAYPAISTLSGASDNLGVRVRITDKHAEASTAQPTLIQEPDDLQTEINRVADLRISGESLFVAITADLDAATADALEMGVAASITYPIQGFDTPRTGVLLEAEIAFHRRSVNMLLLILPEA